MEKRTLIFVAAATLVIYLIHAGCGLFNGAPFEFVAPAFLSWAAGILCGFANLVGRLSAAYDNKESTMFPRPLDVSLRLCTAYVLILMLLQLEVPVCLVVAFVFAFCSYLGYRSEANHLRPAAAVDDSPKPIPAKM
ncbi:MAG: hypothetical protein K2W82_16845 [Candidatus Obscuribacterales bacterium]|nr:hypothetical protein [Candidatus Obscuribacterales bacterium]